MRFTAPAQPSLEDQAIETERTIRFRIEFNQRKKDIKLRAHVNKSYHVIPTLNLVWTMVGLLIY